MPACAASACSMHEACAIKGCPLLQLRGAAQKAAMLEEMGAMCIVAHPHVLRPMAILECSTSGRWGMLMPWAEHATLGSVVRCVSPVLLTTWRFLGSCSCSCSTVASQVAVDPKSGLGTVEPAFISAHASSCLPLQQGSCETGWVPVQAL